MEQEGVVLFNEGMNEMFYLTMHSAHFIYGYMVLDVLFNDTLNTFHCWESISNWLYVMQGQYHWTMLHP